MRKTIIAQVLAALCCPLCCALQLCTSQAAPLDLIQGFEGNYSGWRPADPIIAAGPDSLVTMVSGQIAIFNKQGTKLFEQNLGAGGFWAAQGADQVAEPWVIFDPNSLRFIASAADFGSKKGFLYFAVSKDSNPLGSADWHKYALDRSGTHQSPSFPGVPTYPDNAKTGVDSDAIYVTSSHFAKDQNITKTFSHVELFALAKAPLLSGGSLQLLHDEPVITESYSPHLAFGIQPAIVFGPAPAMYFAQSLGRLPDNKIVVHALVNVVTAPTRSVSLVTVDPFDRPPHVPQLGSSILLENWGHGLMSAVVRNGSLWTSHAILNPDILDPRSLVRWYQFNVTGLPAADATLTQSGNVDPGTGKHAWLPHINVDQGGNMGLTFNVGGAGQYAAIGYTGWRTTDPLGTALPVQIARAGEGPYTMGGWGEYGGLAIDPNGYTFWLFHEYPGKWKNSQTLNWRTFVGAFRVAPPPPPTGPLHIGDLDRSSANSGKNTWKATVVVTAHDSTPGNHMPVSGATVSIAWSNGASGTAIATTGADGKCTFVSGNISKTVSSATLTVTSAAHATLTYSAADNHDPDGDSDGTTIIVPKP